MVMHTPPCFDDLSDSYREIPAPRLLTDLYTGVCSLTTWSFVVLGDQPTQGVPYIGFDGEEPLATAFTDKQHAIDAVNTLVDRDPTASVAIIEASVHESISCLEQLEVQGLSKVRFNHGPHRFDLNILNVIACYERLWFQPAPSAAGQMLRLTDNRWNMINRLPCWYFVGDHGTPTDPVVWIVDGEPCVMLFTDRSDAHRYARGLAIPEPCGGSQVIELSRDRADHFLKGLRSQGVAGALFHDGGDDLYRRIDRIVTSAA